ncbi:hypothetical protein C7S17_5739 [Burkholderia thailandensis]|nr:hypothetical protein [Burkholderia thailandensis]
MASAPACAVSPAGNRAGVRQVRRRRRPRTSQPPAMTGKACEPNQIAAS